MPIPQPKPDRVSIAGIRPPLIWDDGLYVLVDGHGHRCIDVDAPGAAWVSANDDDLVWFRIADAWASQVDFDGTIAKHCDRPWNLHAWDWAWLRVEMQDGEARVVTPDGRALAIHVPVELECFV